MLKLLENAKRLSALKQNQGLPTYKRYIFENLKNTLLKSAAKTKASDR